MMSARASSACRWRAALGPTPNEARVVRWLTKSLQHRNRAKVIHPGVQRVLIRRREQQAVQGDLSLKTLAGIAGLSPSRLMHAFTESVGVPVRPTSSGSGFNGACSA